MAPRLSAAEAIARNTTHGKPRGFTVTPTWNYSAGVAPGWLRAYQFWAIISHNCRTYDESGSDITIVFNPGPMSWSEGDRPMLDENGEGLYTERLRGKPMFGALATFGDFDRGDTEGFRLLFTNGQSPTRPVSREEYLRAWIFNVEGKNGETAATAATAQRRNYQAWLARVDERKKEREQILAVLAAQDPSKVAKTRAEMENAEKEGGEFLRKAAEEERARGGTVETALGNKLRAQIAAMTPEERASPAWATGFDLFPPGTPNAHAIVRWNPDFYRVGNSPVEVRGILVHFQPVNQARMSQRQQMFREFDWSALKRIIHQ
jgi:hypothetical protein